MKSNTGFDQDRANAIFEAREAGGRTLAKIGADFGVGKERVRQIANKEARRRAAWAKRGVEPAPYTGDAWLMDRT